MQTRLIRLASEEWCLPIEKIVELFKRFNVLEYIEKAIAIDFPIFLHRFIFIILCQLFYFDDHLTFSI